MCLRSSSLIILLLGLAIVLAMPVAAHPPSDMQVTYDQSGNELVVTITHQVSDPRTHYIERIEIAEAGQATAVYNYTSQPTAGSFTERFPLLAIGGEVTVTAACNLAGSLTKGIILPGAKSAVPPAEAPAFLSYSTLWPIHALLMFAGFLCFFAAVLLPVYGKSIAGWYRYHTHLSAAGGVLVFAALGIAATMVSLTGGPHLRVPHAFLGLLIFLVLVAVLLLGVFRMRAGSRKAVVRIIHLWMGRFLIVLIAANLYSGLATAGVLG